MILQSIFRPGPAARLASLLFGACASVVCLPAQPQVSSSPSISMLELASREGGSVVTYNSTSWGCAGGSLGAEFSDPAGGATSAEVVRIGHNVVYPDSPRPLELMRIEADGSIFDLGPVSDLGFAAPRLCRNLARAYGVSLSRNDFLRIAQAKSITLSIGGRRIAVRDVDIEGLRALAGRLR